MRAHLRKINEFMNVHIVNPAGKGFGLIGREICLTMIAVMGFALRKNINNSLWFPAIAITEELFPCGDDILLFDQFGPSLEKDSAMSFPDNNRYTKNQAGIFTQLINLANVIDGENLFMGGAGKVYLRIGEGT